ncbi:MAG: hypothetical protein WBD07_02770 [Vicinamibacterales bacterium]
MTQKLMAMEQRLKSLESVLQVTPGGLVLKSPGSVQIQGGSTVQIQGGGTMDLKASLIRIN